MRGLIALGAHRGENGLKGVASFTEVWPRPVRWSPFRGVGGGSAVRPSHCSPWESPGATVLISLANPVPSPQQTHATSHHEWSAGSVLASHLDRGEREMHRGPLSLGRGGMREPPREVHKTPCVERPAVE